MKIAFCHHLSLSYRGGGEKWITQLANELVDRGHEVVVRCLPIWKKDNPVELLDEVDYKEGYLHHVSADVSYVTYNPLSWAYFYIEGRKIGGIHSHCYWQPFALKYGVLPNLANFVHMITKRWELARFDAIHTVTPVYPLSLEKVYYIPDFVDSEVYAPRGLRAEEFTVGYASRKVWQKGYDIFLQLQDMVDDVKFLTTGNIPEKKMPDFYSRNHATIVPARVDTVGLVNIESLLCGTPVISSGLPTHKALGLPIRYAYRLEQYVEEIEKLRVLFESNMYGDMSDVCRNSALKYDKHRIVDKIEEMFKEVVSNN